MWQGVIYLWWDTRAIGVPLKPRSVKGRSSLPPFYACFVLGVQAIGSSGVRGQQIYGVVRCATAVCEHAPGGRGRAWPTRRWAEWSWRTATPHLGDVRLHYVEAGEGPLVVLLHGFPQFWHQWRLQIPALVEAGFRVVAPDMRGYNLSEKPPGVRATASSYWRAT